MQAQDDPTPFFEPLLRSFLLGLSAGALFESAHVALKVRAGDGDVVLTLNGKLVLGLCCWPIGTTLVLDQAVRAS